MITPTAEPPRKRGHGQPEGRIQAECVKWLWNNVPETRGLFIHIPNEGTRSSIIEGASRKALGVVAGAPDTFLFIARNGFHGLAIEFKTDTGIQSGAQKGFQERLEANGYKYVLCRSLGQFEEIIKNYLSI